MHIDRTALNQAQTGRPAPLLNGLLALYLFIYVWSVPMLMLDLVPVWGEGMGAFLLVLQGTIMALWLLREAGARGMAAAVLIGVLAYLVELAGVSTGIPFGRYVYTSALGYRAGGAVPLAIPFAWLMVVPGALMAAAPAGRRATIVVPMAALLALLLDLLLEPVVTHITGYWRWLDAGPYYGVPVSNFVAWGGTALVLLALLNWLVPNLHRRARSPRLPALIFGLNVLQFTLVNAAYGLWWAVLVGAVLLPGLWLLWGRPVPGRNGWESIWIST